MNTMKLVTIVFFGVLSSIMPVWRPNEFEVGAMLNVLKRKRAWEVCCNVEY
jgi:hypothetical protein